MEAYSVLMAVYHKEKAEYFRLAVESMLLQTVPPDEFVLVCDGPLTPPLEAVIREFCDRDPELFRVIRLEKNGGLGAALNIGLQQCRNELVARMDSDDIALRDRMEKQLLAMKANPHVSVLGGQIGEFQSGSEQIVAYRAVPTEEESIRKFLRYRNPMNHMTVVLRKSHVLSVGSYQKVPGFEDYILWAELISEGYHLRNIQDVCCRVRSDAGMYARRGGIRYFRSTVKLERFLWDKKLISPVQFGKNLAVRFAGTMLIPSKLRRLLFLYFLRLPSLEAVEGKLLSVGNGGWRSSPSQNGDLFFRKRVYTKR